MNHDFVYLFSDLGTDASRAGERPLILTEAPCETFRRGIHNGEAILHGYNLHESGAFLVLDRITRASFADRVRSTHWHELFDSGDVRRRLTWKGIFGNVDKTVNFYSSKDEVVANGNDKVEELFSREYAWYNQEQKKGVHLVSFLPEAGWKFSNSYRTEYLAGYEGGKPVYLERMCNPVETWEIGNDALKARPFFKSFRNSKLHGSDGSEFLASHDNVFWYALSHGIPAESFAAGASQVPKWRGNNVDMANQCKPEGQGEGPVNLIHSYFIQRSLFDTRVLFEKLVENIGTTKPKKIKK